MYKIWRVLVLVFVLSILLGGGAAQASKPDAFWRPHATSAVLSAVGETPPGEEYPIGYVEFIPRPAQPMAHPTPSVSSWQQQPVFQSSGYDVLDSHAGPTSGCRKEIQGQLIVAEAHNSASRVMSLSAVEHVYQDGVHIIRVNLADQTVRFRTAIANDDQGGREYVSSMAQRHCALAAINADYFTGAVL